MDYSYEPTRISPRARCHQHTQGTERPCLATGAPTLLMAQDPMEPPWPPDPHAGVLWQGQSPGPHSVPGHGCCQARPTSNPVTVALPGNCSEPWPADWLPGLSMDLPHHREVSWFLVGPICTPVPLTFLCVGHLWAPRGWHRELHSFWHSSCWMMCKFLTACEHFKFPSYLSRQNRSIISWVVIRFSLSDYIQASQISWQASFAETHLYGIHSDRKEDLFFFFILFVWFFLF